MLHFVGNYSRYYVIFDDKTSRFSLWTSKSFIARYMELVGYQREFNLHGIMHNIDELGDMMSIEESIIIPVTNSRLIEAYHFHGHAYRVMFPVHRGIDITDPRTGILAYKTKKKYYIWYDGSCYELYDKDGAIDCVGWYKDEVCAFYVPIVGKSKFIPLNTYEARYTGVKSSDFARRRDFRDC